MKGMKRVIANVVDVNNRKVAVVEVPVLWNGVPEVPEVILIREMVAVRQDNVPLTYKVKGIGWHAKIIREIE